MERTMELNEVNLEKLMQADVNMRDEIDKLEQQIKDIKAKREQVQLALNEACRELNVSSLKTKVGTLSRTLKTRYWTDNWSSMYEFMKEHDALELMEKRLAQGNMKEFLANNPDVLPPGLQSTQEYQVVIRRNRETKE
jgi:phage shock protein A